MTLRERLGKELDKLRFRRRSYQLTATSDMLIDLAKFCLAHDTVFHNDPLIMARAAGRREVWLRIEEHLNLPADQLLVLYSGGKHIINKEGS
jgi:hypothetical protein